MTKKFTEEQYQKIVEIADEFEENGGLGILDTLNKCTIGDRLFLTNLAVEIEFKPNSGIIMAIANQLTREWAHEQFVEKEKHYIWYSKEFCLHNGDFKNIRLFKEDCGVVLSAMRTKKDITSELNHLTESEIKAWGYNPEMFDKEEVD